MIGSVVYMLSTLTCLACAYLLFRGYLASKVRLLMWSALCFSGLTIANVLLIFDLLIVTQDLSTVRLIVADFSLAALVCGLAWEST